MGKTFAEQMIDSMVDENGRCGERGLSLKQFDILRRYLEPQQCDVVGGWSGNYGHIDFTSQNYIGKIGRYDVVLNEYCHFNPRCTVVSIAPRPQAEIDREKQLDRLRAFDGSEWVHEAGERVELELTLVRKFEYIGTSYTYYDDGTAYIYTFADADGNCYVWKTKSLVAVRRDDSAADEIAEIGDTVTVTATIKDHSEYKGVKQNVITRPKFKKIEKDALQA